MTKLKCESKDGTTFFYPAKYRDYEDFTKRYIQTTYTTKILMSRITLLLNYRKNIRHKMSKFELERNELIIRCNADIETIHFLVFNDIYDETEINTSISNIAAVLKTRLNNGLYETKHPEKIQALLEKLENVI